VVNGDLRLIIKKKGRETEKEHFWCSLQSSNLPILLSDVNNVEGKRGKRRKTGT